MSRRTALIVLAIASIALGITLTLIDPANEAEGNPSIVDFEFAWSESRAHEIRAEWGGQGDDAARASLRIDFAYLLAYGAFGWLAVAATRDFAAARGLRRLVALGPLAAAAAIAAPLCDAVENLWLLIALEGDVAEHVGALAPLLGSTFATIKFAAIAFGLAYLIAGLVARLRARHASAGA